MSHNQSIHALESANAHSIGKIRRYNEDALVSFQLETMRKDQTDSLGLYVVADGMGGHINGDEASASAVSAFTEQLGNDIIPLFLKDESDSSIIPEMLKKAVLFANQSILDVHPGSGTTFTAALIWNEKIYIAHVGDSRLFLIHQNYEMEQLTHDHSLVQMMVDLGEISEEEALTHPRRSVLLRSLGFDKDVEVDLAENKLEAGESLLLCCDGLWSVIKNDQMTKIIREHTDIQEAADALVDAANDAGGPDNISCILVRRK